MQKHHIYFILTFFFSNIAYAQLDFTDFLDEDFKKVNEDIVSSYAHTSHIGAASLGKVLGIEAGLVLGVVEANNLKEVTTQYVNDPNDSLDFVPSAGLTGAVTTLFGLGAEVNMIPEIDEIEDAKFNNLSVAARWTITDMFPLPGKLSGFKLALRASQGKSETSYAYTDFDAGLGNFRAQADFETEITEYTLLASYNLRLMETYVSVGQLKGRGDLFAETVSDNFGTQTKLLESDFEGTRLVVGLLFKLPLLRIGVEYSQLADSPRVTAKIALKI